MTLFFLSIAFIFFAWRRLLTYLHIFQQDDYDSTRFLKWVWQRRVFDKKASLSLLALSFPAMLLPIFSGIFVMVGALALAIIGWCETDPRQHGKKKLALTARAARILWTAFALCAAITLTLGFLGAPLLVWIIAVQAIPLTLALADQILQPWEQSVQQKFLNEAKQKLATLKPFTIGITGSFGKTSVKHILAHVLSTFGPTLATPGSINTPMGITRVVRETLTPHHKYFICEMGAYGPGSITRLCDLAPPDAAILTAIGNAHYERFKTLDTVAAAKCELPEAAIAKGGWAVMTADTNNYTHTARFIADNRANVSLVGSAEADDFKILSTSQTPDGVQAEVEYKGTPYTLTAPLFGLQHAYNIALVFASAMRMGLEAAGIISALKTTPQIRHRLEVVHQNSGAIIIDDAYNSNPTGFKAALEVLSLLGEGRRRILISPGMIELGAAHAEEHAKIGACAAQHADIFLPVSPVRITAMVEAFKMHAPGKLVFPCANFAAAQNWLGEHMSYNDIVLLENDLPDLYERKITL